ncbi:MAG: hypothetical protein QG649_764 [Patescibacteria group bacterium]|jgi:hypothetical protein|nr:hypothetical protein [Patescibacteria group bacterium]
MLPLVSGHSRQLVGIWRVMTRMKGNRRTLLFGFAVLIVACGAAIGVNYFVPQDLNDVTVVQGKIERHVILPANEVPALVTVTDPEKIDTPFLKQAQKGDKVLIYQNNRKAIIYRPNVDRLIDIGPVVIDSPKGGSQSNSKGD